MTSHSIINNPQEIRLNDDTNAVHRWSESLSKSTLHVFLFRYRTFRVQVFYRIV